MTTPNTGETHEDSAVPTPPTEAGEEATTEESSQDSSDDDDHRELFSAAFNGDVDLVKALLDKGARPAAATNNKGATSLHAAAQNGHEDVLRILLDRGGDPNTVAPNNWSVLHSACLSCQPAIIRLLLDRGAVVSAAATTGETPLHIAAHKGDDTTVQQLLDRGAEISPFTQSGTAPLHVAAHMGHENVVRTLLDRGADIAVATPESGQTPLHVAAGQPSFAMVQLLLDRGADVSATTPKGATPLHLAAQEGFADAVELLVRKGADIMGPDNWGHTPLHLACVAGHERSVERLVVQCPSVSVATNTAGAPPSQDEANDVIAKIRSGLLSAKSVKGQTALHVAAGLGKAGVVEILIDRGADVAIADSDGDTPVIAAYRGKHNELVKFFLDRDLRVTSDASGWTKVLRSAAFTGDFSTVMLLLDAGVQDNVDPETGLNALVMAGASGHEAIVRLLLQHGSDVFPTIRDGYTILMAAAEGGHEEVVRLLIEHGSEISATSDDGSNALTVAATYGRSAVVRLLLHLGADISARGRKGTALNIAVLEGYDEIVRDILNLRGDSESVRSEGPFLLYAAAGSGNTAIMGMLLDQHFPYPVSGKGDVKMEARVDGRPNVAVIGMTLLHTAVNGGDAAMVRLNLERAPGYIDERVDGLTPLHIAAQKGYEAVAEVLLEFGADTQPVSDFGRTAADWARENGHHSIETMIMEHQARKLAEPQEKLAKGLQYRAEATSYKYGRLGDAVTQTRLLYLDADAGDDSPISGTLRAVALSEKPEYVAVSYTWGEPEFDWTILLDGHPFLVTRNLYAALKRYVKAPNRAFWIDQICINQADENEKAQQVASMSAIYSQASCVWIWLGEDESGDLQDALALARMVFEKTIDELGDEGDEMERLKKSRQVWKYTAPGKSYPDTWAPLVRLYSKPWFSRLWVVQEFVLAREFRFFCGDLEIPSRLFRSCFDAIAKPAGPVNLVQSRQFKMLFAKDDWDPIENMQEMYLLRESPENALLLVGVAYRSNFGCYYAHDRVYGLLGLLPADDRRPKPDYKAPVEEVYKDFARYYVEIGKGAALLTSAIVSTTAHTRKLPSWCPDWSNKKPHSEREISSKVVPDSVVPRVTLRPERDLIAADGCFLDSICEILPPLRNGSFLEVFDDYRAWYDVAEPFLARAVASRYADDGDALSLWCRFMTSDHHTREYASPAFFRRFHDEVIKQKTALGEMSQPDSSAAADAVGSGDVKAASCVSDDPELDRSVEDGSAPVGEEGKVAGSSQSIVAGKDSGGGQRTEEEGERPDEDEGEDCEGSCGGEEPEEGDSGSEEDPWKADVKKAKIVVPDMISFQRLTYFIGKQLCLTEKGYLGLVSPDCGVGDRFSLIYGTTGLTMLREESHGACRIVGTGALLDLPADEVLDTTKSITSEILLS